MKVTGKTDVYGIIGFPLHHSLSPLMQNAALEAAGINGIYVPFQVAPESLADAVRGLKVLGVKGFNVTIPHKESIVPLLDEIAPSARLAGAVNTVCLHAGKFVGHNTDGTGLVASLRQEFSLQLTGASVLLLGAGGAARGAVMALAAAGIARLRIANRSKHKADMIVEESRGHFPQLDCEAWSLDEMVVTPLLGEFNCCINTTSVGMSGDAFDPALVAALPADAVVYDMVYAPPMTPLLHLAAARGLRVANGLGMLAAQGEEGFRLWTGCTPSAGLMKRTLQEAINPAPA